MKLSKLEINKDSLTKLDAYASSVSPCQLLQSSKWLNFQLFLGRQVDVFKWEHNEVNGLFLAIVMKLPLGKFYYYIPRGPIITNENLWADLMNEFKANLAQEKNQPMFIRFEPDASFRKKADFKHVADVQPSRTFYTDLTQDEKDILAAMHQKTRYNIRLALKKELLFTFDDPDLASFLDLIKETSKRDKFSSHGSRYYETMIKSKTAHSATLRDEKEVLAAGIFSIFGDTMTYLHGASSSIKRELMAPYALHWEMLMLAKAEGLKHYDWHGVDDTKWPGFSRFKRGFGGADIVYPGSFDFVLDTISYHGYNVVRGLRRLF